jgi:hypothetical protein
MAGLLRLLLGGAFGLAGLIDLLLELTLLVRSRRRWGGGFLAAKERGEAENDREQESEPAHRCDILRFRALNSLSWAKCNTVPSIVVQTRASAFLRSQATGLNKDLRQPIERYWG